MKKNFTENQRIEKILSSYQLSTLEKIRKIQTTYNKNIIIVDIPTKLNDFDRELVFTLKDKIINRMKRREELNNTPLTYLQRLNIHLADLASCLPSSGYSMGETKYLYLEGLDKVYGCYQNHSTYANSCKYRPTYGDIGCTISKKYYKAQNIGGLITLLGEKRSKTTYKATWIEFETSTYRGKVDKCTPIEVTGYISYADNSRPFHAQKYADIVAYEKRIKENEKSQGRKTKTPLKKLYSYADSIACGNCEGGTKAFVIRLGLDINKKYSGKTLIQLANEKSSSSIVYINRMLNYFTR